MRPETACVTTDSLVYLNLDRVVQDAAQDPTCKLYFGICLATDDRTLNGRTISDVIRDGVWELKGAV